MGTRSITHIREAGKDSPILTTIYRQFDGYPSGMGKDIKDALGGRSGVNGYSDPERQTNGMGCAAALLLAVIKTDCGNVYIKPAGASGLWEDYIYTLWAEGPSIHLECAPAHGDTPLYSGPLSEFDPSFAGRSEAA